MRRTRTIATRTRVIAAFTCLLWMLGIEVLPNLHLATHDETTHTHAPSGMVVTVSFNSTHAHDGSVHSHDAADDAVAHAHEKSKHPRRDTLAFDVPLADHDAAGLAHRALALHSPPAPLLAPLPVVRLVTNVIALPVGRVEVPFLATADARGPPAV